MNSASNYSKTDLRYWEGKVTFQSAKAKTYSVQIQHDKRRSWVGLGTRDCERAAIIARDIYLDIVANGWDFAMVRRQGPRPEKRVNVTIGEYLEIVSVKALVHPKTLVSYAAALRKIAADIAGVRHNGSPRATWRQHVDALQLRILTTEAIEAWRVNFIRRHATNPLAERSAKISCQSLIARARSLFGQKVLPRVREFIELPDPAPFHGIKIGKTRPMRYHATFDLTTLVQLARAELPVEEYKIFLLGAMAGLRRCEIDLLPWTAFHWDHGVIHIGATEYFRPKSRESEADVEVDAELLQIFHGFRRPATGDFVIESDVGPDPAAPFEVYRCDRHFDHLVRWLRSHGVNSKRPLHALRAEFGSRINARYGLFAASSMLRHADIKVTATHYMENKHRSVLGLGHLLTEENPTIVPIERTA